METGRIGFRRLAIAGAAALLLEWAIMATAAAWPGHWAAILGAGRLVQLAAIIRLAGPGMGSGAAALGLSGKAFLRGIRSGLLWSAGFGAACAAVFLIFHLAGIDILDSVRMQLPGNRRGIPALFVVGAFISPVVEEVFFRGLVYGFLRRWGPAVAIAGSTALFTAAHLPAASFPVTQVAGGLLFAAAYEREKSLATPITIHVLGNMAIFSISLWF
jgi:hypothetical protein